MIYLEKLNTLYFTIVETYAYHVWTYFDSGGRINPDKLILNLQPFLYVLNFKANPVENDQSYYTIGYLKNALNNT